MFIILIGLHTFVKTPQIVDFNDVQFILYLLYLNKCATRLGKKVFKNIKINPVQCGSVGRRLADPKVVGLIPGRGVCTGQLICFSLTSVFFYPSFSSLWN